MPGHDRVAIVTVTYSSADDIAAFLESATDAGAVAMTVVADNPSPDSDRTLAIARAVGATVVALPENVGYGGAVNAAVAQLPPDVDYVLVSNPDVQLQPGAVDILVQVARSDPRIGVVGPKILNPDGTVYPSGRRIPSLRTGVGHALFSRVWPRNPWSRSYRQESESTDEARDVGWLSGSCFLIRRTAFEQVGGFDPRYFMYFEDVDLGYRLGKAGWVNRYTPAAAATHVGGRSTAGVRPQMLRAHHRSADRFLSSKYPGWYLAPLRASLHLGLEIRARWLTRGLVVPQASNEDK
ncbi:MAG: glycosyltransferase family 2 protein [Leifsonia sp.]